jgi:aminomethyltransferase
MTPLVRAVTAPNFAKERCVLRTPLYDCHVTLGGRMVEFAGYELPVQYPTGPIAEHNAVRNAAGLFDIDHMGQFELRGPDADLFLQLVQVYDIEQMARNDAHYSLLLYADGTVVDDIFLYKLPGSWLIAVNASNRAKDLEWLQSQALDFDITLVDRSDDLCMLALQGPKAETILQRLADKDLSAVAARTAVELEIDGYPVIAGRTGYTGEDGFELYLPAAQAVPFWNHLLEAGKDDGLLPCGLAARDSLRFEACMPLYGHELSAAINALEARMGWTVSWDKEFIGRSALLKVKLERPARLLVGFEMVDKAVAREHYDVAVDGKIIGHVSSGMKSPTLDKFLGMALVSAAYSAIGTEFDVLVRGQPKKARVVKRPFYKPRYKQ